MKHIRVNLDELEVSHRFLDMILKAPAKKGKKKETVCVCTCAHLQDWGRRTTRTTIFYSIHTQASNHSRDHARKNRRSLLVYWHFNNMTSSKPQTQSVFQFIKILKQSEKEWSIQAHITNMWGNVRTHPSWVLAPGECEDTLVIRDNSGKGCSLGSLSQENFLTGSVNEQCGGKVKKKKLQLLINCF